MSTHHRRSPCLLQGNYLGLLTSKKGQPRYLRIATEQGEQVVKLPKCVGDALRHSLEPGMPLQVWGKWGDEHLKAVMVLPLEATPARAIAPQMLDPLREPWIPGRPSHRIKVCSKGTCHKRGSGAVWKALQSTLEGQNTVQLEATGCLKACKQGPNLSMDGVAYHQVNPEQIPSILQRHGVINCLS